MPGVDLSHRSGSIDYSIQPSIVSIMCCDSKPVSYPTSNSPALPSLRLLLYLIYYYHSLSLAQSNLTLDCFDSFTLLFISNLLYLS